MNYNYDRTAKEEREEFARADVPYVTTTVQSEVEPGTTPYMSSTIHDMSDTMPYASEAAAKVVSATPHATAATLSAASTLSACGYRLSLDTGRTPPAGRALRVVHVGPCVLRGGAEQWLADLVRFLDPSSLELVEAIVTRPDQIDLDLATATRFPVKVGQADMVRKAAAECDVLLAWGVELNKLLGDVRPPLCVYVAHGDGDWTNQMLVGSDRYVDHVVAVSRRVASLCCHGFPTTVIWNGVDTTRLAHSESRETTRSALGFGAKDFVLGYVGRFSAEKRVEVLIDAVAELPPRFKLLLVGWGPLRHELMEMANSRIPGRYAITTAWEYLGDYYRAMDAMGLVSSQEGYPLVLLEAMLCGCPTITTSVGCVPEVIQDRINGLVVAGDASSVSESALLLDSHRAWAHALGEEGKAFAEQNGHARGMARKYEGLLHRLWLDKFGLPPTPASAEPDVDDAAQSYNL
jgi:glycosyltransferase involved in cell wall biosynthesis